MPDPIIFLDDDVFRKICAYAVVTRNEFSGFGWCEVMKEENGIFVYDFEVLDVGSYVETTIGAERILPLMQREDARNMKAYIHRHPLGNGIPGLHNWSGTDEFAIRNNPLGGMPEQTKWSLSIVLTPLGLVGRMDKYKNGKVKTVHLEVLPNFNHLEAEMSQFFDFGDGKLQDAIDGVSELRHSTPKYGQLKTPSYFDENDDYMPDWRAYKEDAEDFLFESVPQVKYDKAYKGRF
jgi:hypothetical protein